LIINSLSKKKTVYLLSDNKLFFFMLQKRRFNSIKWFFNTQVSRTGTRNNCPPNNGPGQATYIVEAGKHRSRISQADADTLAQTDLNNNTQTYVNNNATCTPLILKTVRPLNDGGTTNWMVPQYVTSVDVFLVGGGGGGGGAGGGGGYTKTFLNIPVVQGQTHQIIVGWGGEGGFAQYSTTIPPTHGNYSQFSNSTYRAEGGKCPTYNGNPATSATQGADGGSGGGGMNYQNPGGSRLGGSNGGNGAPGFTGGTGVNAGGIGQGTTTRDFGEPTGLRNAGGAANTSGTGGISDYTDGKGWSRYNDTGELYMDGSLGGGGYGGGGYGEYSNYYQSTASGDGGFGTVLIRFYG
jgi:hypothetical protein